MSASAAPTAGSAAAVLAALLALTAGPARAEPAPSLRTLVVPLDIASAAAGDLVLDLEAARVIRLPAGAASVPRAGPPGSRRETRGGHPGFFELTAGRRLRPAPPPDAGCRMVEAYFAENALVLAAGGRDGRSGSVSILTLDCAPAASLPVFGAATRFDLRQPPAGPPPPLRASRGPPARGRAPAAINRQDPVGAMVATARQAIAGPHAAFAGTPAGAAPEIGPRWATPRGAAATPSGQIVTITSHGSGTSPGNATRAPAPSASQTRITTTSGGPGGSPAGRVTLGADLTITKVAGDLQSAGVRERFPLDLLVVVTRGDVGEQGVQVTWSASGGAQVENPTMPRPPGNGFANVSIVAGSVPGPIVVIARLPGADPGCPQAEEAAERCVRFDLTATGPPQPGCQDELSVSKEDPKDDTPEAPLQKLFAEPFELKVLVKCGNNPQPGANVGWQAIEGRALLEDLSPPPVGQGLTGIKVTPDRPGRITVTAKLHDGAVCPSTSCVVFYLESTSDPTDSRIIRILSGTPQTRRVGVPFDDLVVEVLDDASKPVPGARVTWQASTGANRLENADFPDTTTDADGRSRLEDLEGRSAGEITITARIDVAAGCQQPNCVTFSLTAEDPPPPPPPPPPPTLAITKLGGDNQESDVGTKFANPLVVQVRQGGELQEGVEVTWAATADALLQTPGEATARAETKVTATNANGRAQIELTPTKAGAIRVTAQVEGAGEGCPSAGCVVFDSLTGKSRFSMKSPSGQDTSGQENVRSLQGKPNEELTLRVTVTKDGGMVARGERVDWNLEQGDARLAPDTGMTGNLGGANASVMPVSATPPSTPIIVSAKLDGAGPRDTCVPEGTCVFFEIRTSEPPPPADLRLEIVSGDNQLRLVGEPFAPLEVRVVNQVAPSTVAWALADQGRDVRGLPTSTTTSTRGLASVSGLELTSQRTVTITAKLPQAGPECPSDLCVEFTLSAGIPDISVSGDLALRLAEVNLRQILSRLAALRRGGPSLTSEFAALEIQGVRLPFDALASLGAAAEEPEGELEIAGLLSGEQRGGAAGPAGSRGRDRLGMFVSGIVAFGERPAMGTGDSAEAGFDFHTDGLMVGMDYDFDSFFAGGAASFVSTGSDLDGGAGQIDVEGLSLASYLLFFPQPKSDDKGMYLDAVLSFGRNSFTQERKGALPGASGVEGTARADFSGNQLALHLGGGYERNKGPAVIGGFASLSYVAAEIEAYKEQSGDQLTLVEADAQKFTSLLASLGMDLSWYRWIPGGVLAPSLRVAYRRELEDDSQLLSGRLDLSRTVGPGPPLPFAMETQRPDRGYFNVALSLLASFERWTIALGYDQDLARSDFDLKAITLGARFGF